MSRNYANAKDVLPPELLALVQRHHTGHLWVPPCRKKLMERDDSIRGLYAAGVGVREIASRFGISNRRIWQILKHVNSSEAIVD